MLFSSKLRLCLFVRCLAISVMLASLGAKNLKSEDWLELKQHLVANQRAFESDLRFQLECRIESQTLTLENEFTLPITNSAFLLASNGKAWRYSEVLQGDDAGAFSVNSNNEIKTQSKRMYWSAQAVITDGMEGSHLHGMDFLDFLPFDIGNILEESGFIRNQSGNERDRLRFQRPQYSLVRTIDAAMNIKGSSISREKIDGLECLTVSYGDELFSVCPELVSVHQNGY